MNKPLSGSRVHFVGIGGVGMAALAELLLDMGYSVSGSDLKPSRPVSRLVETGAVVTVGPHRPGSVGDAQHVVVSSAIREGNPEVVRARELGAEVLLRAELLARIFEAGRGVAVSGTHGKTTTASMLAAALTAAGLDPSFVIGGDLNDVGSGARLGSGDLVVAEADEAFGSFLHLKSHIALVTNVDVDHLDHYGDLAAIDEAFVQFLNARTDGGTAVVCAGDPGVQRIAQRIDAPVVTYGFGRADLGAEPRGKAWALSWRGTEAGILRPRVPGRHNVLNACGAAAAAFLLDAPATAVLESLSSFAGVERRFSIRGASRDVVVVDDYAHHPREVSVTLLAARERFPGSRIIALFQPHLFSRTQQLAGEFESAFEGADVVVVTDIYGAREDPIPGVSGRLVVDAVNRSPDRHELVTYAPLLDEAAGLVAGMAAPGDVVVTLGAGDVTSASTLILELIAQRGTPS
ncbi:MAG TPA: UDP-N-acetylmuramate--L-alanine ligase [Actinomycetota bacterium]|nr:UDP-N-acetylmuramate--L-alanine ligase [Actinomycetota bacterium]